LAIGEYSRLKKIQGKKKKMIESREKNRQEYMEHLSHGLFSDSKFPDIYALEQEAKDIFSQAKPDIPIIF
jgi:hypothetical protein